MAADPYDLNRFISAQENIYPKVISELNGGYKQSHWMWFIFPQIDGLGRTQTARHYAIKSKQEADEYLRNPILGSRLLECSDILLSLEGRSVSDIFAYPDDLKLHSCMTLFSAMAESHSVFEQVLDKYFESEQDTKTLQILETL